MTRPTPPENLFTDLAAVFGDRVRQYEMMAEHTTLRVGGPADLWLAVESIDELVEAVGIARQFQTPVFILGGGANVLVTTAGIRGLVIQNRAGRVDFPGECRAGEQALLTVESGVVLPGLAHRCGGRGLSGLEWAVGVPGTIGGAVVNNAGAYGRDMAQMLVRAELLSPDGQRFWQPVEWFQYGYRTSILKKGLVKTGWVVLRAKLGLTGAAATEVQAQMTVFNERRKASQPPGATIGSMFKNPPGDYAGRLIESAGLKGRQVGQAQISPVHANFFQNLGNATAADVLTLLQMAQTAVRRQFGVDLELEIEIMGELS